MTRTPEKTRPGSSNCFPHGRARDLSGNVREMFWQVPGKLSEAQFLNTVAPMGPEETLLERSTCVGPSLLYEATAEPQSMRQRWSSDRRDVAMASQEQDGHKDHERFPHVKGG